MHPVIICSSCSLEFCRKIIRLSPGKHKCKNYALISGHPGGGGMTPGNPRAFAPRHLQIPLTQGQYSSTKSYHCPSPGEHNLKGLPNCNVISSIIFNKSLTILNIHSTQKQLVHFGLSLLYRPIQG